MLMDGGMERRRRRRRRNAGDGEMTMMKHGCAALPHLRQLFSDGGLHSKCVCVYLCACVEGVGDRGHMCGGGCSVALQDRWKNNLHVFL